MAAMAMLMGVLVIAFPVSVFSDLWSNELKQRGVDYEEVIVDDDKATRSPSPERKNGSGLSLSVRFSDEVSGVSERTDGTSSTALPFRERAEHPSFIPLSERTDGLSLPEDGVVLDADDVAALTEHMRIMEKSQERIRGILAKYDIET